MGGASLELTMYDAAQAATQVTAVVQEVLPQTGLAYLTDAQGRSWVLTKGTAGLGLAELREGQTVMLTLEDHQDFQLVSGYAELD